MVGMLMPRKLPSPIWPHRVPRHLPPVSDEAIVEAALGLLDREGVDAVTMRRVAERMGVTTPTIYWHVENKDGLLERLYDRLCSEVARPSSGPWQDRLRLLANSIRAVFAAHCDAAKLAVGRFPLGPHGLELTELALAALAEAGLDPEESAHGVYLFFGYVTSFSYQETILPTPVASNSRSDALKRIEQYLLALPEKHFPHVTRSAGALSQPGLDRRFAFGLEQLLLGLTVSAKHRRDEQKASKKKLKGR
jgi:TetR/AcrR family transcriptional regulator, tetracycline repressor protein